MIATMLACAFINRTRGGGVIPGLGGRCDDVAAILFGIVCWSILGDWLSLPVMAVAFRLGEMKGWGQWVGVAIGGGMNPENGWLDKLLRRFETNPDKWAFLGLMARGGLWGLCLSAGAVWFSPYLAVLFFAFSLLMPVCYFATRYVGLEVLNDRWALAELIMGAIAFGIPLGVL